MPALTLKRGADELEFATDGNVRRAGAAVGRWTTDGANALVYTPSGGGAAVTFPLGWRFNDRNHLCAVDAGTTFDFHTMGVQPKYSLRKGILCVELSAGFTFEVRGEWDFDGATHELQFVVDGVKSRLVKGYLNDDASRFVYTFTDRDNLARRTSLVFVGRWTDVSAQKGTPYAHFTYTRADDTTDTFELPNGLTFNSVTNQFSYEYDQATTRRKIQLVGSIRIGQGFQLTYTIVGNGSSVTSSEITLKTRPSNTALADGLELTVVTATGADTQTRLRLSGQFSLAPGPGGAQVRFSIEQGSGGAFTFGLGGTLVVRNDDTVEWSVTTDGRTTRASISAQHIRLKNGAVVDVDASLQHESGGRVQLDLSVGIRW